MDTLRLGTRGSELALFQANAVAALLAARAGVRCTIVVIKTSGDRLAEASLAQIGGKRLFVKEIEDALLDGAVDLAVHSSKDMPAVLPEGLSGQESRDDREPLLRRSTRDGPEAEGEGEEHERHRRYNPGAAGEHAHENDPRRQAGRKRGDLHRTQ